jgi:hypothetical protein
MLTEDAVGVGVGPEFSSELDGDSSARVAVGRDRGVRLARDGATGCSVGQATRVPTRPGGTIGVRAGNVGS